jgi:hypothetical protein
MHVRAPFGTRNFWDSDIMIPIANFVNLFALDYQESIKNSRLGVLSIRTMVRERVFRWNSLCDNLLYLGNKLTDLGLVCAYGQVEYVECAEELIVGRIS